MKNNWNKVVSSLFFNLKQAGFTPLAVDNGDGKVTTPTWKEALEEATACDEASVYLKHPDRENRIWLYIVLGNSPEELVADYTVFEPIEAPLAKFSSVWEGKPCPTI